MKNSEIPDILFMTSIVPVVSILAAIIGIPFHLNGECGNLKMINNV